MSNPIDLRKDGERVKIEIDVDLGAYGEYALSKLENVSIGGAFIRSRILHDVGTELHMRFELPGDPNVIEAEGEVVWTYDQRGQTNLNASGMGVRFTQILQSDRDRIKSFIATAVDKS